MPTTQSAHKHVVVIGGANVDVKARSAALLTLGTSNPGRASVAAGGVARNIAENLARLGTSTYLVTAVGRDAVGDNLLAQTATAGVHLDYVHRTHLPTGTYTAVLDSDGELVVAVADMGGIALLGPEQVNCARDAIAAAGLVVLDGNLGPSTIAHALELARAAGVRTVLEPVSAPKSRLLAAYLTVERPFFAVTPNREELTVLTGLPVHTDRELRAAANHLHQRGVENVWVRLGARGSLISTTTGGATFVPAATTTVEDVTGAGDAMLAAFCHALLAGRSTIEAVRYGAAAAALTIASHFTVRPDLTPRLVEAALTELSQEQSS